MCIELLSLKVMIIIMFINKFIMFIAGYRFKSKPNIKDNQLGPADQCKGMSLSWQLYTLKTFSVYFFYLLLDKNKRYDMIGLQ